MTIAQYINLPIIDENERVCILTSEVDPVQHFHIQLFKGLACDIPSELRDRELWAVSALGEESIKRYHLDRYGWTGLFVEEEEDFSDDSSIVTL